MQLDNEYLMQDTMLQDYSSFYIDIKTAKQTKTVKYEEILLNTMLSEAGQHTTF